VPKYVYYCKNCENDFEIKHTLQELCTICEICEKVGPLERRPSAVFLAKKESSFAQTLEPGKVVKASIEETKEDIAAEKRRLENRKYKK